MYTYCCFKRDSMGELDLPWGHRFLYPCPVPHQRKLQPLRGGRNQTYLSVMMISGDKARELR